MSNNERFRRLTSAEITPDTFNLPMYAYFAHPTCSYEDFLLPVAVLDYRKSGGTGGTILIRPGNAIVDFPTDAKQGIWIAITEIWVAQEKPKRKYLEPIPADAIVMTIAEWSRVVGAGDYTALHGIGRWCKDGKQHNDEVYETGREDATHVAWYPTTWISNAVPDR